MENFEKLKQNMPDIQKIVATFPEPLQEKVFVTLVSELLGKREDAYITESKKDKSIPPTSPQVEGDLSAIATLTSDGQYHFSVRDLKATSARDAVKRLVYIIIRSYTELMNTSSVSRKKIINPEISKWRLADGHARSFISSDKGIIKRGDEFSLDIHAQSEADQYIRDIKDSGKIGSWKPGATKKQRRIKDGSKSDEDLKQESGSTEIETTQTTQTTSNNKPQTHSLEEVKTTLTIAQILNVKTEMDLILAAAMKFHLVDNKETFNRQDILKEMQTAQSYYRASYLNNATKYLKKLVREGKLRENAPDLYALSANTKKELRQNIGLE